MKLIDGFYNPCADKIKETYFPELIVYWDSEESTSARYKIELFSNGCLGYAELIQHLSLLCNDTKENIHNNLKDFVIDWEGYVYDENEELDLFEFPQLIPANVQQIIDSFSHEENEYDVCEDLVSALESVGYTCDYDLDGIPCDLKKIV